MEISTPYESQLTDYGTLPITALIDSEYIVRNGRSLHRGKNERNEQVIERANERRKEETKARVNERKGRRQHDVTKVFGCEISKEV